MFCSTINISFSLFLLKEKFYFAPRCEAAFLMLKRKAVGKCMCVCVFVSVDS